MKLFSKEESYISKKVQLYGNVESESDISIDGSVYGNVRSKKHVMLGATAVSRGTSRAIPSWCAAISRAPSSPSA